MKCEKLVARYTPKMYASDRDYESFLRLMHKCRVSSGSFTQKALGAFKEELNSGYELEKSSICFDVRIRHMEDILSELD